MVIGRRRLRRLNRAMATRTHDEGASGSLARALTPGGGDDDGLGVRGGGEVVLLGLCDWDSEDK